MSALAVPPASTAREPRSHVVPGKIRITEHYFDVPLDYSKPEGSTLRLFARSARKHDVPLADEDEEPSESEKKKQLPWLLFLQGGPGFGCSQPQDAPFTQFYLERGYQLLLMDQRGTGLSSPITGLTNGGMDYLQHFRADSIVRDCEAIRQLLTKDYPEKKKSWSLHGQSFGGFCAANYLSFYPKGLKEVFLTGGLPPLADDPDPVYDVLFRRVAMRNQAYYEKYPEDVAHVKYILQFLKKESVELPSQGILSPRRFLQLGMDFGHRGGFDRLHGLILAFMNDLDITGRPLRPILNRIDQALGFDEAVIYTILHEPIYCQGRPSLWSAERVMADHPEFELDSILDDPVRPNYFTGEMVFPFMLDDYAGLRPLKEVANELARKGDWPRLYDETQLLKNEVPVFAAVYIDDMFVDYNLSQHTASKIKGCKMFITNTMYHDALRSNVNTVLDSLWLYDPIPWTDLISLYQ